MNEIKIFLKIVELKCLHSNRLTQTCDPELLQMEKKKKNPPDF